MPSLKQLHQISFIPSYHEEATKFHTDKKTKPKAKNLIETFFSSTVPNILLLLSPNKNKAKKLNIHCEQLSNKNAFKFSKKIFAQSP